MLAVVSDQTAPQGIIDLADQRARARAARDFARADELRVAIEASGWRIEDDGRAFRLSPAETPDVEMEGRRFHGSVASVPSRLEEAASRRATIVIDAGGVAVPEATLESLRHADPTEVQVVVVAGFGVDAARDDVEVVATATRFSAGDAMAAALRRATGRLVVVLAPDVVLDGDVIAPLEAALADPEVVIAGAAGLASADLRRFRRAPAGDVAAVGSGCYAYRRADAAAQGDIDARLNRADGLAVWLSLALRDRGPDAPPRRAVALALPLRRTRTGADADAAPAPMLDGDEARLARRDQYRIADRFGGSRWLTGPGEIAGRMPQEGAQGDDEGDDGDEGQDTGQS
jgi:hypothetical protein